MKNKSGISGGWKCCGPKLLSKGETVLF